MRNCVLRAESSRRAQLGDVMARLVGGPLDGITVRGAFCGQPQPDASMAWSDPNHPDGLRICEYRPSDRAGEWRFDRWSDPYARADGERMSPAMGFGH